MIMSEGNARPLNTLKVLTLLIPLPLLTASIYFFGRSYIEHYNKLWSIHNIGYESNFIDLVYLGFVLLLGFISKPVLYVCLIAIIAIFAAMLWEMVAPIFKERKKSNSHGNESLNFPEKVNLEMYVWAMGLVTIIPVTVMVVLLFFINARDLATNYVQQTKIELDSFFNAKEKMSVDFSFKHSKHSSSYEVIHFKGQKEPVEGYVVQCSASFCVVYTGIDQLEKIPVDIVESRHVVLSQK